MQRSMKFPRAIGTTLGTMTTNMVGGMEIKTTITKAKKDFDKKPWQNKDQKSWNKDHKTQYGNKESKPKDACITVTKNVKYFCPAGFDEGIFNALTKLLHEKVEQAKRSGSGSAKTINTICNTFKIISLFIF